MLPMSEDFLIDLSPSCTKEQAVLRLLGWGAETIKKKYIKMNHAGHVVTDMKEISPTTIDLHELLTETYQEALQRFEDAVPKDATEDEMEKVINEHGPRIEEAESFVQEARSYLMDITDELAKNDSELRIDQEATDKVGSTCITIRSLEEWAEKRYRKQKGSSTSESSPSPDTPDDLPKRHLKVNQSVNITLALAIKALANMGGRKYQYRNDINVKSIVEKIDEAGRELTKSGDASLRDQSISAISGRVKDALEALDRFIHKS